VPKYLLHIKYLCYQHKKNYFILGSDKNLAKL